MKGSLVEFEIAIERIGTYGGDNETVSSTVTLDLRRVESYYATFFSADDDDFTATKVSLLSGDS
jgi:hypothetical protein